MLRKSVKTLLLVYLLRLVGEDDRIAVESDAYLIHVTLSIDIKLTARADDTRGKSRIYRLLNIVFIGGKKEVCAESVKIRRDCLTANKSGASDIQTVVFYGIEDAQTCVGAVFGHYYYLGKLTFAAIQIVKRLYQRKRSTGAKDIVFVFKLIFTVRLKTLLFKNAVFFLKIEKCAGAEIRVKVIRKDLFAENGKSLSEFLK